MEKDYADIFCEAVDVITKKAVNNLSFNKTIKGIIKKSEGDKEVYPYYNVFYQGQVFKAKVLFGLDDLKDGDFVYILIINGDFSEDKFILSKASV